MEPHYFNYIMKVVSTLYSTEVCVNCGRVLRPSYQPLLWREERLHVGGVGGGDAAADGPEPSPHAADAYRHPVPHHVSPTRRLRHEHPVPPHHEAGLH